MSVPEAVLPQRARQGDAGVDLVAIEYRRDYDLDMDIYSTGISVEIPEGHVGLLFPRSSVFRKDQMLANSVGVIDAGYRGEIKFMFRPTGGTRRYQVGERVGQLVIVPILLLDVEEVDQLSDSERGEGGFGSTGH